MDKDFCPKTIINDGLVKIRIEAVGGALDRVAERYPRSFMDEMARQLTAEIESALGIEGLGDSSVELIMTFAQNTYLEHTSENITYRRLMLVDKVSAPRDFWVKWTRLAGNIEIYSADNIRFELGEDVEQKIREREYRYLLSSGKEKYHNSMGRKKVTEWREVIRRAAKRGELTKIETDFELAPETLELEERIADILGKRISSRNDQPKEEIPYIHHDEDQYNRALEKIRSIADGTSSDEDAEIEFEQVEIDEIEEIVEIQHEEPDFEEVEEAESGEFVFERLTPPEAVDDKIDSEFDYLEEEEEPEEEIEEIEEAEEIDEIDEIFDAAEETIEKISEALGIELPEKTAEAEEEETDEIFDEVVEEIMEKIAEDMGIVISEKPAEEEPDEEEPAEEEIGEEEPDEFEKEVIEDIVREIAEEPVESFEERIATPIADRAADIRAELETKIRLEYEIMAREKAERELIALRRERDQLRLEKEAILVEKEAILAEAEKEQERLRLEYDHLVEKTARAEAQREEAERQRMAEEAQLRIQIEEQLRAEAKARERYAEAARMAIEDKNRLEAENDRLARQREEEARIEAERFRREREERELEALRQAELERIRREEEEARERARAAMPEMGDGRYSYTSKSVRLVFRRSVDPNVTTTIQEIIKATVEYYGKDRVYLKIRASVPDSQTVVLDFEHIPIEEMTLLGNIIKILGHSGLGIAKAIVE